MTGPVLQLGRRSPEESLRRLDDATELFVSCSERLDDADLDGPSLLPGWSRGHLLAHVCTHAETLVRLAAAARTGERLPGHPWPEQTADIESGAGLAPDLLRAWVLSSAAGLGEALELLDIEQWHAELEVPGGHRVRIADLPWLRIREMSVHAVDLGVGLAFSDLPVGLLVALMDDALVDGALARRLHASSVGLVLEATDHQVRWQVPGERPIRLTGSLASLLRWITRRPGPQPQRADGGTLPALTAYP